MFFNFVGVFYRFRAHVTSLEILCKFQSFAAGNALPQKWKRNAKTGAIIIHTAALARCTALVSTTRNV